MKMTLKILSVILCAVVPILSYARSFQTDSVPKTKQSASASGSARLNNQQVNGKGNKLVQQNGNGNTAEINSHNTKKTTNIRKMDSSSHVTVNGPIKNFAQGDHARAGDDYYNTLPDIDFNKLLFRIDSVKKKYNINSNEVMLTTNGDNAKTFRIKMEAFLKEKGFTVGGYSEGIGETSNGYTVVKSPYGVGVQILIGNIELEEKK